MKKRGRTDLFLILCGILIWFLTDAARIRAQAAEALLLCGKSVIPALFPFLVVSSLLIGGILLAVMLPLVQIMSVMG